MLTWVKKLMADDAGNPSSMRIMGMLVLILVLGPWAYCVIKKGEWIPLDGWITGVVASVLGSKALQKAVGEPNANGSEGGA